MTPDLAGSAFERDLRAVLLDEAAGPLPPSVRTLSAAVVDAATAAQHRRRGLRSWLNAAGSVGMVAAVTLIVVAAYGGFLAGRQVDRGVGGPGSPASPSPGASATPAVVLDSGVVRLTADSITIHVGDRTFPVPAVSGMSAAQVHSDPGSAVYRTLEVEWTDQGAPLRLYLYFAADDDSWWVSEIRTYDGSPNGAWIFYQGPFFEAPLGLGWTGDFDGVADSSERGVPGRLEIRGMRLDGFLPATIPADSVNCRPLQDVDGIDLAKLEQMTPVQADAVLRARNVCHSFRYMYPYDQDDGYSERWCVAPPGVISRVQTSGDGALVIIFVNDVVPAMHTPRPQPPQGWGC
jgi:hypothetical protein